MVEKINYIFITWLNTTHLIFSSDTAAEWDELTNIKDNTAANTDVYVQIMMCLST